MKKLKYTSLVFLLSLSFQCAPLLVVPDISGYIAALISLLPKTTESEYNIKVTVSGLSGKGLVLQNNGGDDLTIATTGTFPFVTKLKPNASYKITILTQPSNPTQLCKVSGGTGTVVSGDVTSIVVNCADSYTVGGTVTGLAGTGLFLQDSGGLTQSITANGSFAFATTFTSGATYNVTVQTQPISPSQTCTVTAGSGVVANTNITSISVNCTTNTYTVGGTLTGLSGTGLIVQNNGGDNLPLAADGTFTFATAINSGLGYSVTVLTQPTGPLQTCTVSGGTGTIVAGNITSITVNCSINTYTIGGTITGLSGTGLVLQNNAGDNLNISSNGGFAFATPLNSGAGYNVTVLTQPTALTQTCVVGSATGTVAGINITTVSVNCTTNTYSVGGTVSGIIGTGLVLQNSGGDNLPLAADGTFSFATAIASGAGYTVTILTQPTGPFQTCNVTSGTGTVTNANITSVSITCGAASYSVAGTLTGLTGTGLVIQDSSSSQTLPLAANGAFVFGSYYANGAGYSVSIQTQASSQYCAVTSGASGTIAAANVTNVVVTCYGSGSLDITFNSVGYATRDLTAQGFTYEGGVGIGIDLSGDYIIGGGANNGAWNAMAWRYSTTGSADMAYGTSGFGYTSFMPGFSAGVNKVVIQTDGKALFPGTTQWSGAFSASIMRLNTDGTFDTGFAGSGVYQHPQVFNHFSNSLIFNTDGSMYLAGSGDYNPGANWFDHYIAKITSTGSLDTTWGGGGNVGVNSGQFVLNNVAGAGACGSPAARDLGGISAVDSMGNIWFGGFSYGPNCNDDLDIFRVNPTGTALDTNWNGTGIVVLADGSVGGATGSEGVQAFAVDSSDRLIVVASGTNGTYAVLVIYRYNWDGTLDTSFGTAGKVVYDPGGASGGSDVKIDSSGRILVSGYGTFGGNQDAILLRYTSAGVLDTNFAGTGVFRTNLANADSAAQMVIDGSNHVIMTGTINNGANNDMAIWRIWNF